MKFKNIKWPRGQTAFIGLFVCALFVVGGVAFAQSGGGYTIKLSSIDGGASTSSGGGYTLRGTIGQPDASLTVLSGSGYTLHGGITQLPAPVIVPPSGSSASPVRNYYVDPNVPLAWSSVTYATGYWVQVARDKNFLQLEFDQTTPASQLSIVAALPGNGTYYWRVRALNGAVVGKPSVIETIVVAIP
jgi:hypothetical protein